MQHSSFRLPAIVSLTCLALSSLDDAHAQLPQPTGVSASTTAIELSPLQQDKAILEGVLDNGLRYIIRPTSEPAGCMGIRLHVQSGSLDECPETSGLSHFLEHLVFNGNRHYKRGELIPAMQKRGLEFGRDVNAYTGFRETVFMIDLPNIKDETVDFCMTVMRDFADGASLTDEAIDKERGIIESELKARDSEGYRAAIKSIEQLTEGTRVATYTPIGDINVIRNAPYDAFKKIYRDHYTPDRQTIIITGDVEPQLAKQWIEKHFGDMPQAKGVPLYQAELPEIGTSTYLIENASTSTTSVNMSFVRPYVHQADSIEQRVAQLPLKLACAMLNNRLQRMVKQEDCPFISASVSKENLFQVSEVFIASAEAKDNKYAPALSRIEQELRRACTFGFQDAELEEAIAAMLTSHESAAEKWLTLDAASMSKRLIDKLDEAEVMTDGQEDLRAFKEGVKRIAAQPSLCQEALSAWFKAEQVKLSITGVIPEGLTKEAVEKEFADSLQQVLEAPQKIEKQEFAYDEIGKPGSIVKHELIEDIDVTTLSLSNGVKVTLKPMDYKKGSISVMAAIDGGALRMPKKPGLADYTSCIMNSGGLEAHSMEDLESIFSANQVGFDFEMKQNCFQFSGATRMSDLETQCKLLIAMIMHPGYRKDAERLVRHQIPAMYKRVLSMPEGVVAFEGPRYLFGEKSPVAAASQAELESCAVADVKKAMSPMLKDAAMEVCLVGDFDLEEVLPILERTFGAMPKRKASFKALSKKEVTLGIKADVWGKLHFLPYDTEIDKTLVSQVFFAGDGRDHHRNRRMIVLESIVSEKLFDSLRAVLGEAYSPTVSYEKNDPFDQSAYIIASSSGVKGNRELVSSAMDCTLSQIGQGSIKKEDFEHAYVPIIADIDATMRQPAFWQQRLSLFQAEPERLELIRDMKKDFESITYEEMLKLAKEVFGQPSSAKIFVVPSDYEGLSK